ncbi:ABC transporter ATP-binding protein/permease [Hymenobacter sp. 5516J-16]|uniref:ABC transporter ATP-binding protein/permease n=1 Tax=Hymenobacter sublimis TaxID=2933777 RepID=A0ABY4J8L7_9BACT|nr:MULTISPECIES: ABC transporter ATP-binding protein [Hymenobacter]UOQ75474.1 ABC transporter ATP-binding protein/permease [Hymenobacter sp. 5516J-16]UPL49153.1 ABC transporter ATP-binding protein/permease [Hymenobacter sublimis]
MRALSATNTYLLRYKWHFLGGVLFVALSTLLAIFPAQIVRYAFDLVSEGIDLYHLYAGTQAQSKVYELFGRNVLLYGVLILLMALLRGIFLFFMRQTLIVMSRHVENDQKNEIYQHYQSLPLSFYRRHSTGDLMSRISEDVGRVRMYIGPALMYFMQLVILFVLIVPLMLMVNVKLTLYTLLPLPILSVSIFYVNNLIEKKSDEIQRSLASMTTFVQEAFSGIRVLKSFVREEDSHRQFAEASEHYKQKSLSLNFVNSLFFPLILFLVGISTIVTVWLGGQEVIRGTITTGSIAEFLIYVNLLTWPVTALGWTSSLVQRAEASQARINEFMHQQTDIVSRQNLELELKGDIVFEHVTFTYPDTGIQALRDVSFRIRPGQTLAVIGNTGAGKSTVAAVLSRLYDVTSGRILIDGVDVRDLSLRSLRSQIGYVPQDVFLFSDSIRNNINFGLDAPDEERMLQAAKDANVYENILRFPEGFDTKVGERGITLSGGQKQRVSIARALVKEPKILILDDALSAVDTNTENAILGALQRIMHNRTSLIISHRVSSVKLADEILVLDDGQIVQHGTHENLMQDDTGLYRALYERQLQSEEA